MTTLQEPSARPAYQGVDELQTLLDGVHNRRWLVGIVCALCSAGAILAGGVLVAGLCGYWPDQPPATLRWGILLLLILVFLAAVWLLARSLLQRANLAQTARFIELHYPQLRNGLINSLLLSRDADQPSPALVQCAIRETLQRVSRADVRGCVSLKPLRTAGLVAAFVVVVMIAFLLLQPGAFRRGLRAVLSPASYVPANNTLPLASLTPGDTTVIAATPVTIRLSVQANEQEDVQAELVLEGDDSPRIMHPRASPPGQADFEYRIAAVHEPTHYRVQAHSRERQSRWPAEKAWYRIDIASLNVEAIDVHYEYPEYTHQQPRDVTLAENQADLVAPLGSWATLSVRLSQPLARGVIEFTAGRREELTRRDDGLTFQTRLAIQNDSRYRLTFFREDGGELLHCPNSGTEDFYAIRATPDAPPRIAITKPARDVTLAVGSSLSLRIEASDDYRLADVQLLAGKAGQPLLPVQAFPKLASQAGDKGVQKISRSFSWDMKPFAQGDVIVYRAIATDNRTLRLLGGPQATSTPTYRIELRNPAQVRAESADQRSELQRQLFDLLARQRTLRAAAAILPTSPSPLAQTQLTGATIYDGQKRIHADLETLSRSFPFPATMDDLRQAIASLAADEAALAVAQAQPLPAVTKRDSLAPLCGPLLQTQDAILETLHEMLAILPVLAKSFPAADAKATEALSEEQLREKRRQLTEAMKQFLADQKKVIDATQSLQQTSLDDFTDADEAQLKALAALQDQWDKFLSEAFADFSKLAEQDFANPSLLKEFLSVQSDVTMARDALKTKAMEIATAMEDNGIENAEALAANIEKWLPDKPDREKWAMEAPEQQENVEQAELPTELEDLTGELLEQEEDLFEEMDDVSSKATMSGDKGIGWDAMDGPISNMNAQGVTGNQLPNTSEIQGRSGEGRTGKSSGEFVEDKAVGKAGRRTPTRVTNDPYQAGQIKDTSTESPSGATGGGKLSGAGAEGLEGPPPTVTPQQMQRLAGKQASIVNRAERMAAQLKISDYSAFRLNQAVLLMNRVQRDLEAGRYQNALRRRTSTLRALRQTRDMLTGQIDVQRDASAALPKDKLDDITDAMQHAQPKQYKEALQQYYQRLSENANP